MNTLIIREVNTPRFLSSSIFNLLDAMNAISIPEKKAENNNEIIMMDMSDISGIMVRMISSYFTFLPVVLYSIASPEKIYGN